MHILLLTAFLLISSAAWAEPVLDVVYWDSETGKALRARIAADADYWQLAPNFTVQ